VRIADDCFADCFGIGIKVEQDSECDPFALSDECQQDMLRSDVVVTEHHCLAPGELENLLRAGGERDLARRHLVTRADDASNLDADFLDGNVERLEHTRGDPLLLAQQTQQDVLRPDVVVLEQARFVLREDDDLTRGLGKAFERGG
jgi:hypothetical protein